MNPATRTKTEIFKASLRNGFQFSFGYDTSTETYKVVAFCIEEKHGNATSLVKVFSLGENTWRNIQCFPAPPLHWFHRKKNDGVYLSGTINWLALHNHYNSNYHFRWDYDRATIEQYVIVSLDLSTETYTQLSLPRGFDVVPRVQPKLVVMMDCLFLGHDFKNTHFVIWKMMDFGVQESWIQLF